MRFSARHNTSLSIPAARFTNRNMKYVRLGNSGLKVSQLILGCMSYGRPPNGGEAWLPWLLGEDEAIEHIKAAYDAGIQTFDTANVYSNGLSEIILGKAIKQLNLPREEIVVMTKVYGAVGRDFGVNLNSLGKNPDDIGYVNQHGLGRKHIFHSVKQSLERLQLDYIDLLQCHRFDKETPIAETMEALHDVIKAGYVRYIGMSSCYAYQFHAMQNYAISHNLTPFISMQNQYSLVYREEEREMFPTLKLFQVGAMPWAPIGRGILARPFCEQTTRGADDPYIRAYRKSPATETVVNRVDEIAKKRGISMAQIAIAWLLSKEGVTAPIVGTTSLQNLLDIVEGVNVELQAEEIEYLEAPYLPQNVTGHS